MGYDGSCAEFVHTRSRSLLFSFVRQGTLHSPPLRVCTAFCDRARRPAHSRARVQPSSWAQDKLRDSEARLRELTGPEHEALQRFHVGGKTRQLYRPWRRHVSIGASDRGPCAHMAVALIGSAEAHPILADHQEGVIAGVAPRRSLHMGRAGPCLVRPPLRPGGALRQHCAEDALDLGEG